MATIKSEFNLPDGNGGFNKHHLETELAQIEDIVRQPSTQYSADVIKFVAGLPTGWYLECTTDGETASTDITLPASPAIGDTITDGTVTWTIRAVASTADIPAPVDISGKANVDLDNLSVAGDAKITAVAFAPRWDAAVSVTAAELVAGYTAPANGFVYIVSAWYDNQTLSVNDVVIGTFYVYNGYGRTVSSVAIKHGDVVKANSTPQAFNAAWFVPAN